MYTKEEFKEAVKQAYQEGIFIGFMAGDQENLPDGEEDAYEQVKEEIKAEWDCIKSDTPEVTDELGKEALDEIIKNTKEGINKSMSEELLVVALNMLAA